jgi:thioredoxin-like negative regulator of GroEL
MPPMSFFRLLPLTLLAALAAACSSPSPTGTETAAGTAATAGIAWHTGDVDAAFVLARQHDKPLFLYWGAEWCPYCAELESSVFSRADFIALSREFIAVHVDGDDSHAPALGERFRIRGYPATILFAPDGSEISRLAAGLNTADTYLQALQRALKSSRSLKRIFDAAMADGELDADDWQALADYSWFTDQQQVLGTAAPGASLLALAERCPPEHGNAARTLRLLALAMAGGPDATGAMLPAALPLLEQVLTDPQLRREHNAYLANASRGVLAGFAPEMASERDRLQQQWQLALQRNTDDPELTLRERLLSLVGSIDLIRSSDNGAELPASLLENAQRLAAEADRTTHEPAERQAVIGAAATALIKVGQQAEAEALLQAELPRSQSAYHLMAALAHYAAQRDDAAGALQWSRRAYLDGTGDNRRSQTRLHSAASFLRYLTDKAPERADEIAEVSERLLDIAASTDDPLQPSNRRLWQSSMQALDAWAEKSETLPIAAAMRLRLGSLCAAIGDDDPAKASCDGALEAPPREPAQQRQPARA